MFGRFTWRGEVLLSSGPLSEHISGPHSIMLACQSNVLGAFVGVYLLHARGVNELMTLFVAIGARPACLVSHFA